MYMEMQQTLRETIKESDDRGLFLSQTFIPCAEVGSVCCAVPINYFVTNTYADVGYDLKHR